MPSKPKSMAGRKVRLPVVALLLAAVPFATATCGRELAVPAASPPGAEETAPTDLAGNPGARTLASGERDRYWIELERSEVVRVVAEQRGADVSLVVVDPGGRTIIRVDRPIGATGSERVTILAEEPGLHILEVHDAGSAGSYLVRVVDGPRRATADDRRCAVAEQAYYAARSSERVRNPESLSVAARGYQEALGSWSQADDRFGRAIAGEALGTVLFRLGERERAAAELAAALPLLVAEGELGIAAEVHNSLGALARAAGRLEEALRHYDQAQSLAGPGGNEAARYLALHNLGVLEIYRGRIEDALSSLAAARAGWQRLGRPVDEVRTLQRIGTAYIEVGEADLADVHLAIAQEIAGRHRLRAEAAGSMAMRATAALLREDTAAGEALLFRAIQVFAQEHQRLDLANARNSLGMIYRLDGRYEQALEQFEEAADLFTARRDVATAKMHTAWTLESMGRADEALEIYPELLVELEQLNEGDLVASIHYGWARAALALGRLREALEHVEIAIAQVERRLLGFVDRSLGTAYAARKDDYYALQIEILMSLHEREPERRHDVRALTASESRRARQLLASLAATRNGAPVLDPALAAEREALYRRIQGLEAALDDTDLSGSGGSLAVGQELRHLHFEAERLEARIVAAEPRYAALMTPPRFDLTHFQRQLDPATRVLVVSLGERRSWLWLITGEHLESHPLPGRRDLEALAARAHRALSVSHQRRAKSVTERSLEQLGEAVLGPVAEGLAGERLVVVSDGGLHYVPWAALPVPATSAAPGEPLLERFEVVGLPSLAVLEELRRRAAGRSPPPGMLAVVADPVTEGSDSRLPAPAQRPAAADAPSPPDDLAALAAALGLREFPRLPYAGSEAAAILALAPADRRWSAIGFEAHREALLRAPLGRYRYVHFAVHVVPSEMRPHLSGLVLSRYAPDGRRRNALLRFSDVFRLDLPVDLVVLSGCRSGGGKAVRGEGIVGLTRGFMAAGAPRVVVSLWDINDRATAELMTAFYRRLFVDDLTPAAALRAAQRELRASPGHGAPYYWAGFVLQGDWR